MKINLLEQNLILSIKKEEKIFPFLGISTPDENHIYVNYLLIGKHLSLHSAKAPFIKHQRNNNTKNNIFERLLSDFSRPDAYEIIEGYSFNYDWLKRKNVKSFSEAQIKIFDTRENCDSIIYHFDEIEKAGWEKGGLGVRGVLLSTSREPELTDIKKTLQQYFHSTKEKETRLKCKFGDKCLLLSIYNDETIPPSSYRMESVRLDLNLKSKIPGAELIIKIPKKWDEDFIVKNTGWERIGERESPV